MLLCCQTEAWHLRALVRLLVSCVTWFFFTAFLTLPFSRGARRPVSKALYGCWNKGAIWRQSIASGNSCQMWLFSFSAREGLTLDNGCLQLPENLAPAKHRRLSIQNLGCSLCVFSLAGTPVLSGPVGSSCGTVCCATLLSCLGLVALLVKDC